MSFHYHKATNALISSLTHGERMIPVIDQKRLDALLEQARARDEEDWEEAKARVDSPHDVVRGDFNQREAKLLTDPPMMLVENPDCLIPADAIPLTDEEHAALVEALNSERVLAAGKDGRPVAVDVVPSAEEALARLRSARDKALAASDWTQIGDALSEEKRAEWVAYRTALRDAPAAFEKALRGLKKGAEVDLNALIADHMPGRPE